MNGDSRPDVTPLGIAVLAACALTVAGCNGTRHGDPPSGRCEATERVNANLSTINRPLHCSALVSFKFRDDDGRRHSFFAHDARLLFSPPQSLLFDVKSLAGVVAEFGSNDERYWVWIEPEIRKLWWGEWSRAGGTGASRLPVPPEELLDALLLRPLPASLEGGLRPVLRVEEGDYRLVFTRLDADGQTTGLREIRLDSREPYQPVEIIDRLVSGDVLMRAHLSDYRRVEGDGPYTPRRYVVEWPQRETEMRLDILRAKFRPDLPAEVFDFPAGWDGARERIDGDDGVGELDQS